MEIFTKPPRIAAVRADAPSTVHVTWVGGPASTVDLAGWIAGGEHVLAALTKSAVFEDVRPADDGSAIEWGEPDGPLAIDAKHVRLLAEEQKPFGGNELVEWQQAARMSNHEAAGFFNVAVSTYGRWKSGEAVVPPMAAMLCRASLRDPLLITAHFRPRRPVGRPRKAA